MTGLILLKNYMKSKGKKPPAMILFVFSSVTTRNSKIREKEKLSDSITCDGI